MVYDGRILKIAGRGKVVTIDLTIIRLQNCEICEKLAKKMFCTLSKNTNLQKAINLKVIDFDSFESGTLRPRVFPTLIAYKNGVPRLGWEGFAAMAPEEIQDAMVLDVLRQAAALADEPDDAPSGEANSAAGAARSEADGDAP